MIKFWTCKCGRANAMGVKTCRCGQEQVAYAINREGQIAPKPPQAVRERNERNERNRQARLKRKIEIPDEQDGFIVSSMPKKREHSAK